MVNPHKADGDFQWMQSAYRPYIKGLDDLRMTHSCVDAWFQCFLGKHFDLSTKLFNFSWVACGLGTISELRARFWEADVLFENKYYQLYADHTGSAFARGISWTAQMMTPLQS